RLAGGAEQFYDLRALDMTREALASIRLVGPEDAGERMRWEIAFDRDNAARASFTWPEFLKDKPVSHMEADSYAMRLLGLRGTGLYEPADENAIEQEPAFTIYVQRRGADSPERLVFSLRRPEGADPLDAGNATFVLESDWQTQPLVVAARDVDALLRTARRTRCGASRRRIWSRAQVNATPRQFSRTAAGNSRSRRAAESCPTWA
ncbi:MAG: hypothetical protein ACOCWR_04605, partial [Oceanidesulfovibrio sp.]